MGAQQPLRVVRPAAEVRAQTATALQHGATLLSPTYATWDIASKCGAPLNVEQVGVHHLSTQVAGAGGAWAIEQGRVLSMQVACRKCDACLKARGYEWGRRAVAEWKATNRAQCRTWFGTLTFAPEERYRLLAETCRRIEAHGFAAEADADSGEGEDQAPALCADHRRDWNEQWLGAWRKPRRGKFKPMPDTFGELAPLDRFRELHATMGPLVTKYLKRLRKGRKRDGWDPTQFRYLLTVEPHRDWTPHYHLLVHEVHPLLPIPQRRLSGIWPHGHTAFRLAKTDKVAFYAAKYLSKCSVARVRASKNYGQEYDLQVTGPEEGDVKRGQIDPPTAPFFSSRGEETGFDWTQGPENGRGMETDQ